MTRPVFEPSTHREISRLSFGEEQLFRRPANDAFAEYEIKVFGDDQIVAAGDGKFIFAIPFDVQGMELVRVEIFVTTVSSSGIVQVQLRNITQAVDMLSTRVQVDAGEKNSRTAATAAVIDSNNDDVAWADEIAIDVDAAGTGAKGLGVILQFSS